MSGLFGIFDAQQTIEPKQFLEIAAQRMSHQPWHVSEIWSASDIALGVGRIGLNIFNREPQPSVSRDGNCILWMCGELYQVPTLLDKLKERRVSFRDESHPELALSAYRAFGDDFVCQLVGAFFIVVYDISRQKLLLTNDRFGLYAHYYAFDGRKLIFAPEVKGILSAPGMTPKLDLASACEYFRFQQILGQKTFHEGILLFPYGSVGKLDLSDGTFSLQRYWDWDQIPHRPEITFDEAVEEAGALLKQSVTSLSGGRERVGVFLSGGLDSRAILGFIPPSTEPPVSANFGVRGSRDVLYAKKIAQAVGSRHHWFNFSDGHWVLENVNLHLKLTEGFHSWVHMHGISFLEEIRSLMDCNLTGWDGGTVMGHPDHVNAIYNHPVDEWTVELRTYNQFARAYTWPGLTDAEERLLFTPEFGKRALGRAFESMLYEFSRFWKFRKEYAAEYFYVVNHCWRFTYHMVTTARSAIEVRCPYWDYDLIDFIYSLPPHIRRDQLMFRTIITQNMPRLANIPYDKEEYLPTVHPILHKVQKTLVRALIFFNLFPANPQLYVDYENYLRGELLQWAKDILFDPRTQQRGIFNMDFIHSLMNRHLAKREDWVLGKIAPLITFEMMMREFFD